jgi:hypothetical protein
MGQALAVDGDLIRVIANVIAQVQAVIRGRGHAAAAAAAK